MLFLVFVAGATFAAAQEGRVIGRIEFDGLQQIKPDEALATSAMKTGRPFKVEEVDAAAQRLLDSGIFNRVGYRTQTTGNQVTITFQVEEAKGGDAPVEFDNFIWFTDDQLFEAVHRAVPSFVGRAPNVGTMPDAITRALQQLLDEQKIPGKVEYLANQSLGGRIVGHVFSVNGIKMPFCTFHFPGVKNVSEEKLIGASKQELATADYSKDLVRVFSGMKLLAIYRELGHLRADFGAPIAKPDPKCKNGVDVTIPVTEGLIYSWGQTEWSGASALTSDQLNQVLGAKPGAVANGVKFDKGITEVMRAYGRQGYLNARVVPKPEFDDSAQKVNYKIEVLEGPQYRMGGLSFKGLSERDAKSLRSAWTLRRGEVFDEGYLKEFYANDLGRALQTLFEQEKAVGKPPPRINATITPNKETLTVDVTLELTRSQP